MKISEAIEILKTIQHKFGDLTIIGGYLTDDIALREICVVNSDGCVVYPRNLCDGAKDKGDIEGVFLT